MFGFLKKKIGLPIIGGVTVLTLAVAGVVVWVVFFRKGGGGTTTSSEAAKADALT